MSGPLPTDVVHGASDLSLHWTTTNIAEGMPGVQSPLSWSVWYPAADRGLREACFQMGVLTTEERASAEPRFIDAFHGQGAFLVDLIAMIGDRVPGTSGEETVTSLLGRVPDGFVFRPTRRRYPAVAWKFPRTFLRGPRLLECFAAEQDTWWRRSAAGSPHLDAAAARSLLVESRQRFEDATSVQAVVGLGGIQPVYDAVQRAVAALGAGDVSKLTAPIGGAEMALVTDMWRASRGELAVSDVVANHGFHGPGEGNVASSVWREDPEPLGRLIDRYAARSEGEDPRVQAEERLAERERVERDLLAATPARWRPAMRLLLSLARKRMPLRGVAKRSMLQGIDGARLATRRLGEHLAADGTLAAAEDAFFFTVSELAAGLPGDAKYVVTARRERHEAHGSVTLPAYWRGMPRPILVAEETLHETAGASQTTVLQGIGASAGVAEGVARVVTDATFADVEPDEILVVPTTDPSWSSIIFISSALVVDIGGALSHAAVVAREMCIPCVVNTQSGTKLVSTGDRVRVDGTTGTIEILARAEVEDAV